MESTSLITKTIILAPKDLNQNIVNTINDKIKEKINSCDENGVIISMGEIKKMTNTVAKDSKTVYFNVDVEITIAKPQKNEEVCFKPSLIIQKGIFGKLYGFINFFIPSDSLNGWSFENNIFKKARKVISKDTEIKVVINDIRYDSGKFNCICHLYGDTINETAESCEAKPIKSLTAKTIKMKK